ncbi:MAG: T9SS type A sorting domain-containing protein [Ignavibacteriales bacterium]|nr:T9SS type A sorting domain-containing protein [Ignavibacteriales bacterium]
MRKLFSIVVFIAISSLAYSQFSGFALYDRQAQDSSLVDSLTAYLNDPGVRSVLVTDDLDGDGNPEVLATDYSNGGKVHVFEYLGNDTLELVWSSPKQFDSNPNSTPRWVQYGDLDGDGNMEIVFPVGPRWTGEVQVWECEGDNNFGTTPAFTLPVPNPFSGATGDFRTERERGTVYDFDDDGRSELIFQNADNKVYILGVTGEYPGFGAWQIEGQETEARFSGGSHWHSVPTDIDGDGNIEIVNHFYNYYGFYSIDVKGTDNYRYPTPVADAKLNAYHEYTHDYGDFVAYMGIQPADLDGDGDDEIAGITYSNYALSVVNFTSSDTGVYIWDSTKFDIIGFRGISGDPFGQFWGIEAADFNNNGRDEIYLGGAYGYTVIGVEHDGVGSVLDSNSYSFWTAYPRFEEDQFTQMTINDSTGIIDTEYNYTAWESPVIVKMSTGDIDGDGKDDLVLANQQNAWDSTEVTYRTWVSDSTWTESIYNIPMKNQINIKVLQYTGTGIESKKFTVITPDDYTLEQNYPNPFNPTTNIRFSLPMNKQISLRVYDILGQEVKTLINNQEFMKGSYEVTWDGTNNYNQSVSSGVYIYTLQYGNFSKSVKMTLMK